MYDQLVFIESPVQIAIVLVIALIVFGPKRLPEIGRQIGSALRELKRAGSDVMRSMNTDTETENDPSYPYYDANRYESAASYSPPATYPRTNGINAPDHDMADYTIVGVTKSPEPQNGAAHEDDPYRIAPSALDTMARKEREDHA